MINLHFADSGKFFLFLAVCWIGSGPGTSLFVAGLQEWELLTGKCNIFSYQLISDRRRKTQVKQKGMTFIYLIPAGGTKGPCNLKKASLLIMVEQAYVIFSKNKRGTCGGRWEPENCYHFLPFSL